MSGLVRILGDLMHDPQLRQAFNKDPEAVITRYGLAVDEKSALLTMDPDTIGDAARNAIRNYPFPDEFPVDGENCLPEVGGAVPTYPAPRPAIFRLRPRRIAAADIQGGMFELLVHGQSFSRDATLVVRRKAGNAIVPVGGTRVFGTFRCSRVRAVITANQVGAYTVQVRNSPNSANQEDFNAPYDLEIV